LLDDTTDACHNKRATTPKWGEKRSPSPPQQTEEHLEKSAAGPIGETIAVSAPQCKKQSKRSADEDMLKKKQQEN